MRSAVKFEIHTSVHVSYLRIEFITIRIADIFIYGRISLMHVCQQQHQIVIIVIQTTQTLIRNENSIIGMKKHLIVEIF